LTIGSVLLGMCVFDAALVGAQRAYKKLPPAGIELSDRQREELGQRVLSVRRSLANAVLQSDDASAWQSEVEVLIRAVALAVEQNLFFKKSHIGAAGKLLDEAERRIKAAIDGERGLKLLGYDPEQNDVAQPLLGGFVSRIDDSVQPYGLVVPAGYSEAAAETPHRLDVWLHGRGDTKTEIPFAIERMSNVGMYAPKDTFVLHPFGRHCNAFKFAGETDVYEAIEQIKSLVSIDADRLAIRGFSMGGAGCWHLAVHDPTNWFAANPGAGFVDTIVYQGWQDEMPFPLTPTAKKLMHWYDVLPWVRNLSNTSTIAYSGEVDKQKQAADRVVERAADLGIKFPYVIGAGMGHKIDAESQRKIESQLSTWEKQVDDGPSRRIDFVTYTLRYSRADWIQITGMREHWTPASVQATVAPEAGRVKISSQGVTHLAIDFSDSGWSGRGGEIELEIDGQEYIVQDAGNASGFQCQLARLEAGAWTLRQDQPDEVRKRPGLQGPIDDAFCERFVIVLPSRPARHGRVQRWINREVEYFKSRWTRLMRGDLQVVLDRDLTEDQIKSCNLICFGDFSSNRFLFNIAERLPIEWSREKLVVGDRQFDPVKHAAAFCYPNPVNPARYVVVNSGMTFREFSNVSNSRQIAMLPDWAVLDVSADDDSIYAGEIAAQGFFDESWKLTDRGGE
jgi:hypothetical protein